MYIEADAVEKLNEYGLNVKDIKALYDELLVDVKAMWERSCIIESGEGDCPYLRCQIGLDFSNKLIWRVGFVTFPQYGNSEEWAKGRVVDVLECSLKPTLAVDYLTDDVHYRRTGKISKKVKREYIKLFPGVEQEYIRSFDSVLNDLLNHLGYDGI